jgi:hypothetical protein
LYTIKYSDYSTFTFTIKTNMTLYVHILTGNRILHQIPFFSVLFVGYLELAQGGSHKEEEQEMLF